MTLFNVIQHFSLLKIITTALLFLSPLMFFTNSKTFKNYCAFCCRWRF
jgi:hypothetical protein